MGPIEIVTWNIPSVDLETSGAARYQLPHRAGWGGKGKGRADYLVDLVPIRIEGELILRWASSGSESDSGGLVYLKVPLANRRRMCKRLQVFDDTGREAGRYAAYRFSKTPVAFPDRREEGTTTIFIYERPDTASFLASIPDSTLLGDISIPGTHESCALYGYPISQCQQPATALRQQLLDGVRFFDVRLRVVGDQLLTYHGIRPERSSLPIILSTLRAFLAAHPSEAVIVLIKEETPPFHPDFARLLYGHFAPYLHHMWLENRIPTLGEARGKVILASRFDSTGNDGWEKAGLGIHPSTWPDSFRPGFEWQCGDTKFRVQDWYRVPSFLEIPEKFSTLVRHLKPTLEASRSPQFTLSYSSASSFPWSFPTVIAKGFGYPSWGLGVEGVNIRFTRWLLERIARGERVRACVMMDFYRQEEWAGELMVLMNAMDVEGFDGEGCI